MYDYIQFLIFLNINIRWSKESLATDMTKGGGGVCSCAIIQPGRFKTGNKVGPGWKLYLRNGFPFIEGVKELGLPRNAPATR